MTEEAGEPAVSPAASGCFRLDAEVPGYLDDPYPVFHALRSQSPVYLAPGGVWYLSRFDDVTAVLSDGRFVRQSPAGAAPISGHSRAPTAIDRMLSRWMVFIDPPRSEEHTSELQSLMRISYAVFCLKK